MPGSASAPGPRQVVLGPVAVPGRGCGLAACCFGERIRFLRPSLKEVNAAPSPGAAGAAVTPAAGGQSGARGGQGDPWAAAHAPSKRSARVPVVALPLGRGVVVRPWEGCRPGEDVHAHGDGDTGLWREAAVPTTRVAVCLGSSAPLPRACGRASASTVSWSPPALPVGAGASLHNTADAQAADREARPPRGCPAPCPGRGPVPARTSQAAPRSWAASPGRWVTSRLLVCPP